MYLCWVCRRARLNELDDTHPIGWGKCDQCSKTREQREPPRIKSQPLSKRERQKAVRLGTN